MTRKLIIVLGKVGHGKTFLIKKLRRNLKRVITIDLMNEYDGTIFYSFLELLDFVKDKNEFNVVLRVEDNFDVEYIFRLCWELRNVWLVIEEAHLYISPMNPSNDFLKLVNFGRHREINIIASSRRVPELSIYLRSQFTSIITFRQTEFRDLENLKSLGFDINKVKNLEKYKYESMGENEKEFLQA